MSTLVEWLKQAAKVGYFGITKKQVDEKNALLTEAAATLGNVATWRGDPEKMQERERRLAREEAERNGAEDDWMGGQSYQMNAGGKPPLTKEAAELLAEVFPKPHEN